jgi:hypothetical protein
MNFFLFTIINQKHSLLNPTRLLMSLTFSQTHFLKRKKEKKDFLFKPFQLEMAKEGFTQKAADPIPHKESQLSAANH